jgi:hypothetical protein
LNLVWQQTNKNVKIKAAAYESQAQAAKKAKISTTTKNCLLSKSVDTTSIVIAHLNTVEKPNYNIIF